MRRQAKAKPLRPRPCRCGKVALYASTTGKCWECDNRAAIERIAAVERFIQQAKREKREAAR